MPPRLGRRSARRAEIGVKPRPGLDTPGAPDAAAWAPGSTAAAPGVGGRAQDERPARAPSAQGRRGPNRASGARTSRSRGPLDRRRAGDLGVRGAGGDRGLREPCVLETKDRQVALHVPKRSLGPVRGRRTHRVRRGTHAPGRGVRFPDATCNSASPDGRFDVREERPPPGTPPRREIVRGCDVQLHVPLVAPERAFRACPELDPSGYSERPGSAQAASPGARWVPRIRVLSREGFRTWRSTAPVTRTGRAAAPSRAAGPRCRGRAAPSPAPPRIRGG